MKVVNNFLVVLIVCLIFLLVSSCVEDFDSAIGVSYMDIEGVPNILNNNPGADIKHTRGFTISMALA